MDERDRPSSLPHSLIPYLCRGPQSSTRTTLTSHSEDSDQDGSNISPHPLLPPVQSFYNNHPSSYPSIGDDRQLHPELPANPIHRSLNPSNPQRSVSPTYTNQTFYFSSPQSSSNPVRLPPFDSVSADILPGNSWGEGEEGPSSEIHPSRRDYYSRRQGARLSARVISHPDAFGYVSPEPHRQDAGYYHTFSHQSFHNTPNISPLRPLQPLSSMEPPLSSDRHDSFSFPLVSSLSISRSSPSNHLRQVSTPELEPRSYGSEPLLVNIDSNEGGDGRKNERRRAHSMDIDDVPKKKQKPRKTAVACNFCRGRKLRCNGAKPSCYNCTVRKFDCEYVTTQRRRGPGKAPKGSRSRKGRLEHSGSSSNIGDRLPPMAPDSGVPEKYLFNVITFESQPPDSSPQYPSERHEPVMRRQGSRSRTSRSSSAEDRSDAKDIRRNQSGS